jgi:hypothetical protein
MTILTLVAALAGAVLGLRFKVLILLPAIGVALVAILSIGIVQGYGLMLMVGGTVLVLTVLELGYLVGVITRYLTMAGPFQQQGGACSGQATLSRNSHTSILKQQGRRAAACPTANQHRPGCIGTPST